MFRTTIKGLELSFETAEGLFSPQAVDRGTLAMLSVIDFESGDKVCDLGCGYGVVGILAAKLIGAEAVVMLDVDELAVEMSQKNAMLNAVEDVTVIQSDGFANVQEKDFTKIISHPPYHTDFAVAKAFIEKGFNRLELGGSLYMVTKRREWYENKLRAIFGGVKVWEIDSYYVFRADKRRGDYANIKLKAPKTLALAMKRRKY